MLRHVELETMSFGAGQGYAREVLAEVELHPQPNRWTATAAARL